MPWVSRGALSSCNSWKNLPIKSGTETWTSSPWDPHAPASLVHLSFRAIASGGECKGTVPAHRLCPVLARGGCVSQSSCSIDSLPLLSPPGTTGIGEADNIGLPGQVNGLGDAGAEADQGCKVQSDLANEGMTMGQNFQ